MYLIGPKDGRGGLASPRLESQLCRLFSSVKVRFVEAPAKAAEASEGPGCLPGLDRFSHSPTADPDRGLLFCALRRRGLHRMKRLESLD